MTIRTHARKVAILATKSSKKSSLSLTSSDGVVYVERVDLGEAGKPAISRRGVLTAMGAAAGLAAIGSPFIATAAASAAGQWGGYSNGAIPTAALSAIPWNSVLRLRADAVKALIALNDSFKASFGRNLPINSAYRTYDEQVYWKNYWTSQGSPGFAATPGTSNHGWALAMDIGVGRTDWSNPIYLWMKSNAARFGWVHPAWAEPNGEHPEAWHWEYIGSYVPTEPAEPEEEDDDMANVITVSVPDGSGGQVYWSVNLGDNTKARVLNGTQLTFRRNIGIAEYVNQPPQTLAGYKEIPTA